MYALGQRGHHLSKASVDGSDLLGKWENDVRTDGTLKCGKREYQ